jgi:ankyrin repeat protein
MSDTGDLFEDIKTSNTEAVDAAIAADPQTGHRVHESGVSAIIFACYCHQFDLAGALAAPVQTTLLEAAAVGDLDRIAVLAGDSDLGVPSPDGFTALHYACYFGRVDAARALLDAGADIEAIAGNGSELRPLQSAAASKNAELIALLLERGADPNTAQAGGFTALHSAAKQGNEPMMRALLAAGADPAQTSDDGKTPADMGPLPR